MESLIYESIKRASQLSNEDEQTQSLRTSYKNIHGGRKFWKRDIVLFPCKPRYEGRSELCHYTCTLLYNDYVVQGCMALDSCGSDASEWKVSFCLKPCWL